MVERVPGIAVDVAYLAVAQMHAYAAAAGAHVAGGMLYFSDGGEFGWRGLSHGLGIVGRLKGRYSIDQRPPHKLRILICP